MRKAIRIIWLLVVIIWLPIIVSISINILSSRAALGANYNGASAEIAAKVVLILNCKPAHMRVKPECLDSIEPAATEEDDEVTIEEGNDERVINYE